MQVNHEQTARRDPAEAWNDPRPADGLSLFPVTIAALGSPVTPAERLMALQSGVAKLVEFLTTFRPSRPRLLARIRTIRPLAHR